MQILNAHPEIVVARGYPHEAKFAQKSFRLMSDSLTAMLSEGSGFLGADSRDRFCAETKGALAQATVAAIDRFYGDVAGDQEKAGARYFAEKSLPSLLPDVCRDVYGERAREIILVRDPRDLFCSAEAFNQKRGSREFGAQFYEDEASWFRFIGRNFVQLAARCRRSAGKALAVRYRDLVLDERGAILDILRYLNVSDEKDVVAAIQARLRGADAAFINHRTSPTPADSVSRWRSYRDQSVFRVEDEDYWQAMRTFGYG